MNAAASNRVRGTKATHEVRGILMQFGGMHAVSCKWEPAGEGDRRPAPPRAPAHARVRTCALTAAADPAPILSKGYHHWDLEVLSTGSACCAASSDAQAAGRQPRDPEPPEEGTAGGGGARVGTRRCESVLRGLHRLGGATAWLIAAVTTLAAAESRASK